MGSNWCWFLSTCSRRSDRTGLFEGEDRVAGEEIGMFLDLHVRVFLVVASVLLVVAALVLCIGIGRGHQRVDRLGRGVFHW